MIAFERYTDSHSKIYIPTGDYRVPEVEEYYVGCSGCVFQNRQEDFDHNEIILEEVTDSRLLDTIKRNIILRKQITEQQSQINDLNLRIEKLNDRIEDFRHDEM